MTEQYSSGSWFGRSFLLKSTCRNLWKTYILDCIVNENKWVNGDCCVIEERVLLDHNIWEKKCKVRWSIVCRLWFCKSCRVLNFIYSADESWNHWIMYKRCPRTHQLYFNFFAWMNSKDYQHFFVSVEESTKTIRLISTQNGFYKLEWVYLLWIEFIHF